MLSLFLGSKSELLCWIFLGKNTGILVFGDGCLETQEQMRLDIPMSKDQWDDFHSQNRSRAHVWSEKKKR